MLHEATRIGYSGKYGYAFRNLSLSEPGEH